MNAKYNQINAADTARMLGISKCTLYKYIKDGVIKGVNIGNGTERPRWLFTEAVLDDYITKKGVVDKVDKEENKENKEEKKIMELLEENGQLRIEVENLRKEVKRFKDDLLEFLVDHE